MKVLSILAALAPALVCTFVMAIVHGVPLVRRVLDAMREDRAALELLSEVSAHLSTYGSMLLAFVLETMLGEHIGHAATAAVSVAWFVLMLRVSYKARRQLNELGE